MKMILKTMVIAAGLTALCTGSAAAQDGNAQTGRQLFESKGCYSCHGFVGQGSREGPRLTPPLPFAAFIVQLRTPRAIMPPYEAALVTDSQAADIHAYLASQPKPPDPKSVKLLQ